MSIALLMFNFNENEGVITNIELMMDIVDEILILDSSNNENFGALMLKYKDIDKIKILRVFPTGYPDPFVGYALKHIKSKYVFRLDSDEEPNLNLINWLKNFNEDNDISGFNILRYEKQLKCFDYQIRFFLKNSVEYKGMIHEFPSLPDAKRLDDGKYIIHEADFMTYVNKRKSYLLIEAYDRPFSIFYLSTQSRFFKVFRNEDKILPKYLVYISTFLLFLRRSLSYSSIKLRGYRYNLFLMKYTINRYAYFIQLENRHEIVKINKDIIKNGGIIKYLNLDNSDYVEKLTKNFNWQKNGIEIFSELIEYKYRYGFVCHLILH
jgi:hypothetical protein